MIRGSALTMGWWHGEVGLEKRGDILAKQGPVNDSDID
jgi:hypothetical protein